jgi:hypothetical protein
MLDRTELLLEPVKNIIHNYKIPELQRLVDKDHIKCMVNDQLEEFTKYGKFSILQSFTVAYLKDEDIGYILDGQHRVAAFSDLECLGYNLDNVLVPIVKYNVDTIDDVNHYFLKINKHSPIRPIGNLVASEKILSQLILDNFKHFFKYKEQGTRCNCPYISILEFTENINARNISDKLQKCNKSVRDLWNSILEVNTFLDSISNKQLDLVMNKKFEDCRKKANKEGCDACYLGIFRQFQWLDLAIYSLINSKKISSFGAKYYTDTMKTKRRSDISCNVRIQVWKKLNKNVCDNGFCYTCNKGLLYSDMECGHIIAHALGGSVSLDNLMPVCKSCNRDMGTMNLEEYKSIVVKNI